MGKLGGGEYVEAKKVIKPGKGGRYLEGQSPSCFFWPQAASLEVEGLSQLWRGLIPRRERIHLFAVQQEAMINKVQQTPWQSLSHYTPESLRLTAWFHSGSTYRTPSWDDLNLIASAKAGCYSFHNPARISTVADAMDTPPFPF